MGVPVSFFDPRGARVRRRAAGVGSVVAYKPPTTERETGELLGRALERSIAMHRAENDRAYLAIGAGVALSLGLSVWLSASSRGWQQVGAAISGAGILAAIGAALAHFRATEHAAHNQAITAAINAAQG